jgi:hypothetical protein
MHGYMNVIFDSGQYTYHILEAYKTLGATRSAPYIYVDVPTSILQHVHRCNRLSVVVCLLCGRNVSFKHYLDEVRTWTPQRKHAMTLRDDIIAV